MLGFGCVYSVWPEGCLLGFDLMLLCGLLGLIYVACLPALFLFGLLFGLLLCVFVCFSLWVPFLPRFVLIYVCGLIIVVLVACGFDLI